MTDPACRFCRSRIGTVVLDLGDQPACDYFPPRDDPGPDPVHTLQMWLCARCGLAQLAADPTVPEEPRGAEPAALVAQAADAVGRVAAAGLLPGEATVAEYGSPHGGSWLGLLADRGLTPDSHGGPADLVLDCFGLMHSADQFAALAERSARVNPDGLLLLQYHSLAAIIRCGQWNALRHGHYAYYSTAALAGMMAEFGFSAQVAWQFPLYGGTVLLAASRAGAPGISPDGSVAALMADEARAGVRDPAVLSGLQRDTESRAKAIHDWLVSQHAAGRTTVGYGAASRAVALLRRANVDAMLLPVVMDASPAKQGLRMPGTGIPIANPEHMAAYRPDSVLLFLSDLLAEVRDAYPGVEAAGGRWVDADALGS